MSNHPTFVGQYVGEHPLTLTERDEQSEEKFLALYGVILSQKRRDNFRMVKPIRDYVKGFPHFGEVCARATDGVTLWVEITWHPLRPVVEISKVNFLGKVLPPNAKDTGGFGSEPVTEDNKQSIEDQIFEEVHAKAKLKRQIKDLLDILKNLD